MAGFTTELQSLEPSFSDMSTNLELANDQNGELETVSTTDQHGGFVAFSINGSFSDHQQQPHDPLLMNFTGNMQGFSNLNDTGGAVAAHSLALTPDIIPANKNKKMMPKTKTFEKLSPLKSLGGRKRKRNNEKDVEKPREVIHVRAKRGQATDSHSLAERVRREKINERLRCLQDLVPGCYKTMGMAVMLDVIINYVQSLQNQIEFLSMKLSAASMYYDFNMSETEAMQTLHQGMNAYEVHEMEKMAREGYGGSAFLPSSWPL